MLVTEQAGVLVLAGRSVRMAAGTLGNRTILYSFLSPFKANAAINRLSNTRFLSNPFQSITHQIVPQFYAIQPRALIAS
jgi:hypothetical protein